MYKKVKVTLIERIIVSNLDSGKYMGKLNFLKDDVINSGIMLKVETNQWENNNSCHILKGFIIIIIENIYIKSSFN